jgi:hypothetical protein
MNWFHNMWQILISNLKKSHNLLDKYIYWEHPTSWPLANVPTIYSDLKLIISNLKRDCYTNLSIKLTWNKINKLWNILIMFQNMSFETH